MKNPFIHHLIDVLYAWITTFKGRDILKDTTKIHCKYDAFLQSTVTDPLSFTIFEMSSKGELIIDDPERLVDSQAAFFLFVEPQSRYVVAIKNTTANQAKLIRREPLEHYRVKIIP